MRNVERAKDRDFNMTLGVNVRYFREQAGLTNKQVAQRVSYGEAWVSNLENYKNKRRISERDVERLAKVLGVPTGFLTSSDPIIEGMLSSIDTLIRECRYDDAVSETDRLIEVVKADHGPRYQSIAYNKRGNIDFLQERYIEALDFYRTAHDLALSFHDDKMYHDSLQNILNTRMQLNQYDIAENLVRQGLQQCEDLQRAEYLQLLARIFVQQEKWYRAEETLMEAIQLGQANGASEIFLMQNYQLLSVIYVNAEERFSDAITTTELVLDLAYKHGHDIGIAYGLRIQGEALLSVNQKESAKAILKKALEATPAHRLTELMEIEFLLLCSDDITDNAYKRMKNLLINLEQSSIAMRSLAKLYVKAAKVAGELKLINEVISNYDRAFQIRSSIIK